VYGKKNEESTLRWRLIQVKVLSYVHSDVWGPVAVSSNGGAYYFVNFIDDFSRTIWVYFMRHKLEVFTIFKQWKA
jgi:transposase InsO family protein